MLTGEERRKALIAVLEENERPISGTDLAKRFEVSRQVIVQDIALLRATNKNILSTNKGYILFRETDKAEKFRRIIQVFHKEEDIEKEFQCIVDCGAKVVDVFIEHEIYGQIAVDMLIQNRQDAANFVEQLKSCQSKSLSIVTDGKHYHTIEADKEEYLDSAAAALKNAGFLIEE